MWTAFVVFTANFSNSCVSAFVTVECLITEAVELCLTKDVTPNWLGVVVSSFYKCASSKFRPKLSASIHKLPLNIGLITSIAHVSPSCSFQSILSLISASETFICNKVRRHSFICQPSNYLPCPMNYVSHSYTRNKHKEGKKLN